MTCKTMNCRCVCHFLFSLYQFSSLSLKRLMINSELEDEVRRLTEENATVLFSNEVLLQQMTQDMNTHQKQLDALKKKHKGELDKIAQQVLAFFQFFFFSLQSKFTLTCSSRKSTTQATDKSMH
eukprot:EC852177.1.p1 GENE.EC852177.1~~EC852177.1.p1  ORF type:complete len:124 (+),score=36.57 EC852177.1:177-548(+)